MQTSLSGRPPSACPSGLQGNSSCPKPLLLLCHLVRKILSANMGIPLHAFVSSCRKTIGFFQSLLNGLGFGSAKDTGLASSRGGGLRLLYPTTESFSLQFPSFWLEGKPPVRCKAPDHISWEWRQDETLVLCPRMGWARAWLSTLREI